MPVLQPDGAANIWSAAAAGVGSLLALLAKSYAVLLVAVFLFQRKLLFMPPQEVVDPSRTGGELILLPQRAGNKSKAAENHAAVYFAAPTPDAPVLVFFHGNGDQLGWTPAELGEIMQNCYSVGFLGIEYPGYGLASGQPSESSIYEAAEDMLRHMAQDRQVERSRIVLMGHSIGGGVATEMASRGFASKLILVAPFISVTDMACCVYPFLAPVLRLAPFFVRDQFDNAAKAKHIKVPTLVVHGHEDEIVPFAQGRDLAKQIPRAILCGSPGVGHNDIFEFDAILREIVAFAVSK